MSEVSEDDGVGYRKPPRRSQFQKGKSGNPNGRPKGSGVRTAMEKVAARTIPMTVEGKRSKVPATEALLMQMLQRALEGDATARRDFLKIADQVSKARAEDDAKGENWTVIVKRYGNPAGCNGALEVVGVVVEVDDQLKVQPWVVEAARARGLKLSEIDEALVEEFTVQAGDEIRERMRGDGGWD
jgi:hypothetical protein